MHDAAQVHVVAARARQDTGEVAVHHRVRQRQKRSDRDDDEDVLLGPESGREGRDDREHEPERVAERVEDEDVGGTELADEPGRLANEKPTCCRDLCRTALRLLTHWVLLFCEGGMISRWDCAVRLDPLLYRTDGFGHALDDEVELLLRARKGRSDQRLVACIAVRSRLGRVHDEPPGEGFEVDLPCDAERRIEERHAVPRVDVVDAEQIAMPSYFSHQIAVGQGTLECPAKAGTGLTNPLDEPMALEVVEHGHANRAGKRRTVPRMAVLEGARAGGDRVVDLLPAKHGPDR